jgi:spermidine synthase
MHPSTGDEWYVESVQPTLFQQLKLAARIYSGHTAYQQVEVIETDPLGRTLVLDGKTQSAEGDEFIYHEALVHPGLIAHPGPRDVFIAGGGEGATLREVLAHRTVERVLMADLDRELVELCKELLPSWHRGAFDDPRAELVFGDARRLLEEQDQRFDAIVIDVTDPAETGPSLPLFTESFYRLALSRLRPGGVLVTQAGPAALGMSRVFAAICRTLREAAGTVAPYRVDMLSFGSNWGFAMTGATTAAALTAEEIDGRIRERVATDLRLYDGAAHAGLFSLPRWLRHDLDSAGRVITEDSPVFLD